MIRDKIRRLIVSLFAIGIVVLGLSIVNTNVAYATEDICYIDVKELYLSEVAETSLSQSQEEILKTKILSAWDSFDTYIDLRSYGISVNDASKIYFELIYTNYKYFYVNTVISYSYSGDTINYITASYSMGKEEAESKLSEMENIITKAVSDADTSWSDLEKALYINDYLAINCEYDMTLSKSYAYNVFVEKKAVCQGYAIAYKAMADKLGLECEVVTSKELNHAWNVVKVGNSYYHVDTTWCDPTPDIFGRAQHTFFLKSSTYFNSSNGKHVATDWTITGDVTAEDALNTKYDSYFWNSINRPFMYVNGKWYGIDGNNLCTFKYENGNFSKENSIISLNERWYVVGSTTSYWNGNYSSLASKNGMLYYSLPTAIYEYNPVTGSSNKIFSLSASQEAAGYIYGIGITEDGNLEYYHSASPDKRDGIGIFTITNLNKNISDCDIKLSSTSYTYNGAEKKPSVVIKDGTTTLIKGTDYTVTYSNNVNAGTATVTITGKGNFVGTVTKKFTIKKASQTVTASVSSSSVYKGKTVAITASGKGTITYSSGNPSIATVNSSGVITGVSAGSTVITVKAAGNGNFYSATTTVKITVLLNTPSISSISNSTNGITVKWGAISGAEKYRVFRKTADSSWLKVGDVTGTTYTDTTAESGVEYTYTVRCINSAGNAYLSNYNKTGKTIRRLVNPTISGVANASNGIVVKWGKVPGADGYNVYRKTGDGSWIKIASVTNGSTVSYTDTTAKEAVTYTYTVRAFDGNILSYYNKTGKTIKRLLVPTITGVSNVSNGVKIKWGKVTGANGYNVYRKTGNGSWIKIAAVAGENTLEYTDKTANNGTTYTYTVRAYSESYLSDYYRSGKTIKRLLTPALTGISKGTNGITVKWGSVTGAGGYNIYRKTVNGSWVKIASVAGANVLNYTDKTTKTGTTYIYTVRAYSGSYLSAYDTAGIKIKF